MEIKNQNTDNPLIAEAIEIVGSQELLGDAIGVSQNAVHKMLKRKIKVTDLRALKIDQATGGKVSKELLCPDSPFWQLSQSTEAA